MKLGEKLFAEGPLLTETDGEPGQLQRWSLPPPPS